MAHIADGRGPSAARGRLVRELLRAELRQFWWLQPAVLAAGLGVWALLAVVTDRVETNARPDGVIFNYSGSLLLSVFPVLLAGPAVAGLGSTGRLGLWLALPLDRRSVNLTRALGPTISLWPIVLTWPLIISLLHGIYGPVPPWTVVNAFLLASIGIFLSFRTPVAPFLVYALLPFQVFLSHFVPGGRPLGEALANWFASPWTSAALLVAGAGTLTFVLNAPRPRRS